MRAENRIDYIEIPSTDLQKSKAFFSAMFGWTFEEWGPEYMSFNDGRFDGGFYHAQQPAPATGVLVIFFSEDLEKDLQRVQELGCSISKPIFPFPGGRRFHFIDPTGNEFAIWTIAEDTEQGE